MDSVFLDDLRYAKEIKLDEFRAAIGVVEDARATGAMLFSRLARLGLTSVSSGCPRGRARRERLRAWQSAPRRATAGESSRTCSSTPSATGTRRQLADGSSSVGLRRVSTVAPRAAASDVATRRSSASPVSSLHFLLDDVERDALALADLDREQLKEVAVVVRRRGAGAFWSLEQPVGDVKANRARARRGARRGVGRTNAGSVDEGRDVGREAARVPGRVSRVRAQGARWVIQP